MMFNKVVIAITFLTASAGAVAVLRSVDTFWVRPEVHQMDVEALEIAMGRVTEITDTKVREVKIELYEERASRYQERLDGIQIKESQSVDEKREALRLKRLIEKTHKDIEREISK